MQFDFLNPFTKNKAFGKKPVHYLFFYFFLTLVTTAWWLLTVAFIFSNRYSFFSVRGFSKGLILLPFFFIACWFVGKFFIVPALGKPSWPDLTRLILSSLILAFLILVLFPFPKPAFQQEHTLQIHNMGPQNEQSKGAVVEIRKLNYLDGTSIPLDEMLLSGDWQVVSNSLISVGDMESSSAELTGLMPGGVVLRVRHNFDAGQVVIVWDGDRTSYDLFAPQSVTTDLILTGQSAFSLPNIQYWFLAFVGLFSILFLFGVAVEQRWPNSAIISAVIVVLYTVIIYFFIVGKLSYVNFSALRVYRDTISYAETAGAPWFSLQFWAGVRPFTYPLLLKAYGINLSNYDNTSATADAIQFQYWFSIIAWFVFAFVLSLKLRRSWLKPLAFGLILSFGLNLEISIWESILITESISISLFVLLLTAWLLWDFPSGELQHPMIEILKLGFLILVSIFYIFTRESNQYFVLIGAILFPLAGLIGRASQRRRKYYWAYFFAFILVVLLKTVSFSTSNLWQIHIYDHLALRILKDEGALTYFTEAGLPVSDELMGITEMPGYEYQEYLRHDPEMKPAQDWINRYGVATYIKYLVSQPIASMVEPFRQLPSLLNGDNLEYHSPRFGVPTIPVWLVSLTNQFYPRESLIMWGFLVLMVIGIVGSLIKDHSQSSWLVVGILLISLYPMLFIVWHGNPMEIERHAAQIGIQYRLGAWMAILLLIDHLSASDSIIMSRQTVKNTSLSKISRS